VTPPADHVFVVGMMGTGKSTAGRLVAERLGRRVVDTDDEVERATGRTVSDIISSLGEAAFRSAESAVLGRVCDARPGAVVAVAGGAVLDPANRALLRRAGTVVWLRARPETILDRVGDASDRVLLQPDPVEAVPRLVDERRRYYEEVADAVVDVDGLAPAEVAARVLEAVVRRVRVGVPGRGYEVCVGPGARRALAAVIPERARRAVVVTQDGIDVDVDPGIDTVRVVIGDGERDKSLATVERVCRELARSGVTRHDVVVAVGGGVVTDVAGFVASCYHRGLDLVNVSTTLLGQVDAAIGGKTGVNLPEGKNLVGAFWQPVAVLCDTDALAGLPAREWRSGFGEMAKYAFLGVEDLDRRPLSAAVARCVAAKAAVVAGDEREAAQRVVLNYGHTLAHALEAGGIAGGDGSGAGATATMRHGEAVGVGLVFAALLARRLGRIDDARVRRHVELVARYGLSTALPEGLDHDELVVLMGRDKKATDGLTFVLDGPDGVEAVAGVDPGAVLATLAEHAGVGADGGKRS
jgi:5-deoxy-5-amino-3-dehydroquinate synthase